MTDALTTLALAPKDLAEAKSLSTTLSKASLLPEALRGKEADVLMIIMTGAELNLAPMQAIRAIDVIKGKPSLKAETMVALVRNRKDVCRFFKCLHTDALKATYSTQRVEDEEPTTLSFTMEQAKTAGLASSDMYRKFPDTMLRHRCSSMLVKMVFSDIVLGLYSDEEAQSFERDVTPVASTSEPRPTPPAAADVATLKADVRKRRNLVREPAIDSTIDSTATVSTDEDEKTVGWGKNAALVLASLDDEKVRWYRDDAEKKAAANADDARDLWAARYARYCSELDRRATSPVAAAESAVAP